VSIDFGKALQDHEASKDAATRADAEAAQTKKDKNQAFVDEFNSTVARDVRPVLERFVKEVKSAGYLASLRDLQLGSEGPFIAIDFSPVKQQKQGMNRLQDCLFVVRANLEKEVADLVAIFDPQAAKDYSDGYAASDAGTKEDSVALPRLMQSTVEKHLHDFMMACVKAREVKSGRK
jgi:hypothetical protein